jgi:hypothetical protein
MSYPSFKNPETIDFGPPFYQTAPSQEEMRLVYEWVKEQWITRTGIFFESESFSTSPQKLIKRGHGTARRRCIAFIDLLKAKGYDSEIPLKDAIELFQVNISYMDHRTVAAYFGRQPRTNTRLFHVTKQYSSGAFGQKTIGIREHIQYMKGYLETLGLAHIEQRGQTWFLILQPQPLVPQLQKSHA